jgi:hypothetical protein
MRVYTIHEQGLFRDRSILTIDPPDFDPTDGEVKGKWHLNSLQFMGSVKRTSMASVKRISGVSERKKKTDRFLVEWVWEVTPEEYESFRLLQQAVSELMNALRETFGNGKWSYSDSSDGGSHSFWRPCSLEEPDMSSVRFVWESVGKWAEAIRRLRGLPGRS